MCAAFVFAYLEGCFVCECMHGRAIVEALQRPTRILLE